MKNHHRALLILSHHVHLTPRNLNVVESFEVKTTKFASLGGGGLLDFVLEFGSHFTSWSANHAIAMRVKLLEFTSSFEIQVKIWMHVK